jgi:hypothetical protein
MNDRQEMDRLMHPRSGDTLQRGEVSRVVRSAPGNVVEYDSPGAYGRVETLGQWRVWAAGARMIRRGGE